MRSIPRADRKGERLEPIVGQPPNLSEIPPGCEFHPRCPMEQAICRHQQPQLVELTPGRLSACHFAKEVLGVDE